MTTTNHLQLAWLTYQRDVIPKDAPTVQYEECRRAFYAGAAALFGLVTQVGEDAVSEEAGAAFLDQINQELQAYGREMARLARELRR